MAAMCQYTMKSLFMQQYDRKQKDNNKIIQVCQHIISKGDRQNQQGQPPSQHTRQCPIDSKGDKPNHVASTRHCTF